MRGMAFLMAVLLVPTSAMAQEVSHSFADLVRRGTLTEGEQIRITVDLSGSGEYEELKTEVLGLTDSTISIRVDSLPQGRLQNVTRSGGGWRVEVPEDQVQRIEQKGGPSGALGAVIGAAGGATAGVLIGIEEDKNQDSGAYHAAIGGLIGGVAGGLALGFLFRSMGSEEVHYTKSGTSQGAFDVSLSPIVSKDKKGALFTLVW
jgi:hypothetical protein